MKLPDIDIDVHNRDKVLSNLKHIPASLDKDRKHNTGVYFHDIPVNPFTGFSSIDYKEAESRGYFKVDILNVSIYDKVKDEEHLNLLMNNEPMWEMLQHEEIVEQLFHIHNHYSVIKKLKPSSIEELACVLAVIRPAKRYLLNNTWNDIVNEVWIKPTDNSYYFKRAHAISYALVIGIQMNLMVESLKKN